MALPKRFYIVKYGKYESLARISLKEAVADCMPGKGEKFSYRIYEGGNSVECESQGGGKFRERRK